MSNLFSIKTTEKTGKRGFFQTVFHLNTSSVDCKDVYLMKWKPNRAADEREKWSLVLAWLEPAIKLETSTWSAVNLKKKQLTSMSSQLEPAIWSRGTGQRIPCFDRCQLTITWIHSGKTSAHLFCAAPFESFSRALVGLLNEIEHDARRAFAPCEVLCLFHFFFFFFFAGLEHMELYTN